MTAESTQVAAPSVTPAKPPVRPAKSNAAQPTEISLEGKQKKPLKGGRDGLPTVQQLEERIRARNERFRRENDVLRKENLRLKNMRQNSDLVTSLCAENDQLRAEL